jgi:hypothetical protein
VHIEIFWWAKILAISTDYLLDFVTLGDVTKNRNDPISSVALPKVAKVIKASRLVSLALALLYKTSPM